MFGARLRLFAFSMSRRPCLKIQKILFMKTIKVPESILSCGSSATSFEKQDMYSTQKNYLVNLYVSSSNVTRYVSKKYSAALPISNNLANRTDFIQIQPY